jgi:Peptidase C13 family
MPAGPVLAAEQSYLIVVSGIGGEAHYSEEFAAWSHTLIEAAEKRLGLPRERIVYLAESTDGGADAPSRKAEIAAAIDAVAARARPGDAVFLLLIGHGTARGDRLLFNLPGPDLSAAELAAMLAPHGDIRWVIVNGAPSSGPFVKALSAPQRIVITATANAAERYHTVFPEHFIAAYAKAGADSDKNGRVSVLEAFTFAERGVQHSYEEQATLQSEHALLDDSSDLARTTYLESDHMRYSDSIPAEELARLLAERDRLEQRIASLIAVKSDYDPSVYDDRLESLLVEFALVHRALRPEKMTQ